MSSNQTPNNGSSNTGLSAQDPPNLAESAVIVGSEQEMLPGLTHEAQIKVDTPAASEPENVEPRHCWICLQDEGVDSPESSQWRSPCPCNLQAHEECLLEWISDIQSQPGSGSGRLGQKVLCPQCKAEIKIERPIELIVALTDLFSAVGQQLLFPTGAGMLIGCLYSGSMVYGFNVIELLFGGEDARRMLFTARDNPSMIRRILPGSLVDWLFTVLRLTDPFVPTGGGTWVFGVAPLIAPALLLARTRIADRTFSILPILYLLFPQNHHIPQWPPSPGLALATLPYIRSAYNELYASVFSDLEKGWDRAVQRRPREGETAEDIARGQEARANEDGDILGIEVEIINVEEEQEGVGRGPHNHPAMPLRDVNANPTIPAGHLPNGERPTIHQLQHEPPQMEQLQDGAPQGGQPQEAAQPAQPAQPNGVPAPPNEGWEFRQNISTAQVARSMIGALFFPAVSSLMGDLIFRTAPSSWVMKPVQRYSLQQLHATGLLQEKWGRSIVGGCLFVVLKDALTLYCKWRKAKHYAKRRVLDYERHKGKKQKGVKQ